jgi:hypothetical protein
MEISKCRMDPDSTLAAQRQIATMFCGVKNQVLSRAFSLIFFIREVSAVGWRIMGLSSDELVSNSPGLYPSHDETFW